MVKMWKESASGLCLVLLLVLSHHFEPEAADVFLVVCLIVAVWHVLGWKFMSRERRAEVIAGFKAKKGIPQGQTHKVDLFLKD
jgi:hypothetical protein